MAFAQDLLDQAYHLANLESGDPKQASLRRAVSTALFHLLIDEAVGNSRVCPAHRISAMGPSFYLRSSGAPGEAWLI